MDFVVAFLLLIILSPLMLAAAVCIAANRDGPVLFRQERPGKNGKIFMLYKFRTMSTRLYDKNGRELSDFERMTKIGRFLRKTSVDELPQLFNILKGDMSLVGPRPERQQYIDEFCKETPEFIYRLKVKAGLTGYAQIYGKYNTTPLDKLKLDLMYIESYSVLLDMKLIFLTLKIMFTKESTEGVDEGQNHA